MSIQSFVLNKYASDASSDLPAISGLKCYQCNDEIFVVEVMLGVQLFVAYLVVPMVAEVVMVVLHLLL